MALIDYRPDHIPKQLYESEDESEAVDKELSPLAQAQMRESELITELLQSVGRLGERLRPILSEEAIKTGSDRPLNEVDKADRLRYGSSPTISAIEQQCVNLRNAIELVQDLARNLEV